MRFAEDDPFFSEISNFVDLIEDIEDEPAKILSDFRGLSTFSSRFLLVLICLVDGVKTYEFTWAIRRASERSSAAKALTDQIKAN